MGHGAPETNFTWGNRAACKSVLTGRADQANYADGTGSRRPSPWPTLDAGGVPDLGGAVQLAAQVRTAVLGQEQCEAPMLDLRPLMRRGGFRLSVERLSAAEGRMEAFLAPDEGDCFEVVVDPEPRGGWRPQDRELRDDIHRHRLRFRVGHEVAHSFFFHRVPGETPKRRVTDSPEQEYFCDAFAGALLLPPSVVARYAPTPENILELQDRYDVSLQLAVRTFADVHAGHSFALLYTDEEPPHVRPQWTSPAADWQPRWWTKESVQRLARRDARAVLVPRKDGTRARLLAMWLPQRRQALLTGP
jgi:hypothetical protein